MPNVIKQVIYGKKIWVITLNRPKCRNAVDRATAKLLRKHFVEFDRDKSARAAVIAGRGKDFCAGADLKAMVDGQRHQMNDLSQLGPMGPTGMLCSKPVIAAVQGHAVAGGLELALWADLRVVEENATFGVYCRRYGVPLIDGGTIRLPRIVGQGVALDMILTGRPVGGVEAKSIGLATRLVSSGKSLDEAVALAKTICDFPQTCLRVDRHSAMSNAFGDLATPLVTEFVAGVKVVKSAAFDEGPRRFATKKKPHAKSNS